MLLRPPVVVLFLFLLFVVFSLAFQFTTLLSTRLGSRWNIAWYGFQLHQGRRTANYDAATLSIFVWPCPHFRLADVRFLLLPVTRQGFFLLSSAPFAQQVIPLHASSNTVLFLDYCIVSFLKYSMSCTSYCYPVVSL